MDNDSQTGRIVAELYYRDPDAALDWLSRAFGFETHMVVRDAEDRLVFKATYGHLRKVSRGQLARHRKAGA